MKLKVFDKAAQNVSRATGKAALKIKAKSPTIAIVGGLSLALAGTALLTYRTVKGSSKIAEYKEKVDDVKDMKDEYSRKEEYKADLFKVRKDFVVEIAKIYGMPIAMVIVGSGGVLYGHHLFKMRNIALMGSNAILQNQADKFSDFIDEKFGEGTADKVRVGVRDEDIEVMEKDENGKEKKKKVTVRTVERSDSPGDYCLFFDESSPLWHTSSTLNATTIRNAEKMLSKKLRERGYLFLDEAYEHLMVPIVDERMKCIAHSVGWVYDENKSADENVVSFRVFDQLGGAKINFVNGYENVILLDPNVQGDVYSKMLDDIGLQSAIYNRFRRRNDK